MFDRPEFGRALLEAARGSGVDSAGVDGHGDYLPFIRVHEPGHAERRVEAAGKSQKNGLGAREGGGCHRFYRPKMERSRAFSSRCSRAPAVAMNMVSSPEMVPTTSGQRAVSMATATLCAEPTVVFNTMRLLPAVCSALTNCLRVETSLFGCTAVSRSTYTSPCSATPNPRRPRLTPDWVAPTPSLRSMATSSACRPTTCSRMSLASSIRRAGALGMLLTDCSLARVT